MTTRLDELSAGGTAQGYDELPHDLISEEADAWRWFRVLAALGCGLLVLCTLTAFWSGPPWQEGEQFYYDRYEEEEGAPSPTGFLGFITCHQIEGDISANVAPFLFRHLLTYFPYFMAVWVILRCPLPRRALTLILAVGLAARLINCAGDVILDQDLFRQLWDGRVLIHGHNPYRYTPQEVCDRAETINPEVYSPRQWHQLGELVSLMRPDRDADWQYIMGQIPEKELPSATMPLGLYFLGFCHLLQPGSTWLMKGLVVIADLGVVLVILALLRHFQFPLNRVLIYAWSPLVLKEFANTGHYDSLGILFMLLGLYWVVRHSSARLVKPVAGDRDPSPPEESDQAFEDGSAPPRLLFHTAAPVELEVSFSPHTWWAAGWLALGALVRMFPLVAMPIVLTRVAWRGVLLFQIVFLLGFLPLTPALGRWFEGLALRAEWEFNSSLIAAGEWALRQFVEWNDAYADQQLPQLSPGGLNVALAPAPARFNIGGLDFQIDTFMVAQGLMLIIFTEMLFYMLMHPAHGNIALMRQVYLAMGVLFLCRPVAYPWYLCWMVPFLCLFPNIAWLYLTFSINAYYTYFIHNRYLTWPDLGLGFLGSGESVRVLEYVPFFVLLAIFSLHKWHYFRKHSLQYLRDHAEPLLGASRQVRAEPPSDGE